MKKILCLLLICILVFSVNTAFAKDIYTFKTEKYITSGIKQVHLKTLTDSGWQNINVIEADLSDKYVEAKVIVPQKGLSNLQTVKQMAESFNTSALVNGDFFAWNSKDSSKGSGIGPLITDGNLLTSSDNSGNMASIGITEDEEIFIKTVATKILVTAPDGDAITLKYLNKFDDLATPSIYTREFYETTPGSFDNILEMVIEDNKVLEMRREQEGVKTPENGYVIRVLPEYNSFMNDKFKEGDEIKIEITADIDLDEVKELSGGGTILVESGKKAKITHNVSGKNPRTVAGCDKTGKILYLVTIDGRQDKAIGMTMTEMQDFLISYGIYNAINLDGGGSTTLVTKSDGKQTVVNKPSQSTLRPVANGLGVLGTAPKNGKFGGFKITAASKNVFKGFTRTFNYSEPYDEFKNPYTKALPEIKWLIDPAYGYFEDNILYATKTGKNISVYATCGTFKGEFKINIIDSPEKISASPSHFDVSEVKNPEFVLTGTNLNAETAPIEERDFSITSNQITKMGYKEVTVKDLKTYLTFSKSALTFDALNATASSYPKEVKASVSVSEGIKNNGIKLSYNFNGYSEETKASYLVLNTPLSITNQKQIGVWVFSPYPSNQWLRAEFKNKNGEILRSDFTESINFSGYKYLTCKIPENSASLTKLYVVQNESKEQNEGYVIFDELSLIETDSKVSFPSKLTAPLISENTKTENSYSFMVLGGVAKHNNLLSKAVDIKLNSFVTENEFDAVWSLSGFDFEKITEKKVSGFSSFTKDNSMFLNIDNSSHYITHTQFGKIKDALSKHTDNLFVFLYEDLNLMTDKEELTVLKNMLEEHPALNKYVFYPSDTSFEHKENGINYICVGNIEISTTDILKIADVPMFGVKAEINEKNVIVKFINLL